jgi:hypothetical protein
MDSFDYWWNRIDEEEMRRFKGKPPKFLEFYSKELLDKANEPPTAEQIEQLHREIDEWVSRNRKEK